jgi:hypothetical protein
VQKQASQAPQPAALQTSNNQNSTPASIVPAAPITQSQVSQSQNQSSTIPQTSPVQTDKCASFFSEPQSESINKIDLPVDCKLNVGKGFESWKFKVPVGQESDAQFELEVLDQNSNVIQKIPIGDIDYSPEAYNYTSTSGDDINFADDINFDGYKDLRVLNHLGADNVGYDYWIFNPTLKKFEKDPLLTDILEAKFNKDEKTISGGYDMNYFETYYVSIFKFFNGKYLGPLAVNYPYGDLTKEIILNDGEGNATGYIKNIYIKNGKKYLDLNRIQFDLGPIIKKVASEITTLEISDDAQISAITFTDPAGSNSQISQVSASPLTTPDRRNPFKNVDYATFKEYFDSSAKPAWAYSVWKNAIWNISIKNNLINDIWEQYAP